MEIRTDLALELSDRNTDLLDGIKRKEREEKGVKFTEIDIEDEKTAEKIGKPVGKYITLEFQNLQKISDYDEIKAQLKKALEILIETKKENILVVGLGNSEITSDAIGPVAARNILATRHIVGNFADQIGLKGLKSVSVIAPDVLGNTGIEVIETLKGLCDRIKPDAIIVIDALAAGSITRLFTTVQLCNTGISPGSGVKNARKELNEKTVGVPVFAIGVPTVVDAQSLAYELTQKETLSDIDLIVTPKDADILCHRISEIISSSLNIFLQPEIEPDIIMSLV